MTCQVEAWQTSPPGELRRAAGAARLGPRPGREPRCPRRRRRRPAPATPTWWCSPRRSPATSASPAPTWRRTPSRSTDRSPSRLRELAEQTGTAWLAGMFEVADDPARPLNTLVLADGDEPDVVPQDPPLRLLRLPRVRHDQRRDASEPCVTTLDGFPLGLMTCYDLRFPELAARPRRAGRRGDRGARRPGWPASARSSTGAPCCAPVPSRTPSG